MPDLDAVHASNKAARDLIFRGSKKGGSDYLVFPTRMHTLKVMDKIVYAALLSFLHKNGSGACFPSITQLVDVSMLPRTTVLRSLRRLEQWHWIVALKTTTTNQYLIRSPKQRTQHMLDLKKRNLARMQAEKILKDEGLVPGPMLPDPYITRRDDLIQRILAGEDVGPTKAEKKVEK